MSSIRAKISTYKIKKIIKHFCVDIHVSKTAELLGINRNTINHWYNIFRRAIYAWQYKEFKKILGEAEIDESYFGAKRIRGFHGKLKRGRGTLKQPVSVFLKETDECIPKSCQIAKSQFYKVLSGEKLTPALRFILMAGGAMMVWWMWALINIIGLIMETMNFLKAKEFILTALRISGALPNGD